MAKKKTNKQSNKKVRSKTKEKPAKKTAKKSARKTSSLVTNRHHVRLVNELKECLMMFADPKATGTDPVLPVSRIVFACQGVITSPPDFCCMGYGVGPEGEAFADTGVLDLSEMFGVTADYPADKEYDDELMLKNFNKACRSVTTVLQQLATSAEFTALPKQGPVIFALSIIDQVNRVLCRIHQNGRFELPPK